MERCRISYEAVPAGIGEVSIEKTEKCPEKMLEIGAKKIFQFRQLFNDILRWGLAITSVIIVESATLCGKIGVYFSDTSVITDTRYNIHYGHGRDCLMHFRN